MIRPRLFLCGGHELPAGHVLLEKRHAIKLSTRGPDQNVNLVLEDLVRKFNDDLSPRLLDLIEIAAYVYAADCRCSTGRPASAGGEAVSFVGGTQVITQGASHA